MLQAVTGDGLVLEGATVSWGTGKGDISRAQAHTRGGKTCTWGGEPWAKMAARPLGPVGDARTGREFLEAFIPGLSLANPVTWGELLNLSELQAPPP